MTQDDHYKNYLIPKGATIMANDWAISRDESMFPDAEAFRPERFLRDGKPNPDVPDPDQFSFGFGRRYVLRLTTQISVYPDSGH